MKKSLALLTIALAAFVAYALLWPSPFAPQPWQAPDAATARPQMGTNDALAAATRLAEGVANGPEDVAIDARGRLYAGYADGTIRRFDPDGSHGRVFATTNGRPLGLDFAPAPERADTPGDPTPSADKETRAAMIVADADEGLLSIDGNGDITRLTNGTGGTPFGFTDDVDVADDGRIYFTDASSKYGKNAYRTDLLEHGGHGRLMVYDPATGKTKVLLSNLQFANGVAVGPDDAFVLVTETGSYRVRRYWLTGDRAGTGDVFIDNLSGFPDGISFNGDGTFWLALFAPRDRVLDFAADKPWLRQIVFHLPRSLQPDPRHVGYLVGLNIRGRVVADLQARGETAFAPVTSVEQAGDTLYLGSLTADAFARIPVPQDRR